MNLPSKYIAGFFSLCLLALFSVDFSHGQSTSVEAKISPLIYSKMKKLISEANAGTPMQVLTSRYTTRNCYIDQQGRLYVRVATDPAGGGSLSDLISREGGLVINGSGAELYCLLPFDKVITIAEHAGVGFIGVGPLPRVRTGSVTSAGDAQLFADKARDLFYSNGANVTVGVISTGMQFRQNSITTGDLPASIISIDNADQCQGSEGTAVMEIVYDLAPGVQLAFGGVGVNNGVPATPLDMANRITHLAQAGCKVIVDDIGWPVGYSQFEDREITGSIETFVQSSGGSYVSACGNDAEDMWAGKSAPSGSNQRKWMLFSGDSALTVTVNQNDTLFVELQWADPWTYSQDNLNLFLADASGNIIDSSVNAVGQGISPEENVEYYVTTGTYRVLVEWSNWYQGRPEKNFKVLVEGGSINHHTSNYHVYGHAASQNGISVAAYNASSPNNVESFSSRGPSLMVTSGGSTFERQTPKITATDGVETKVGRDGNFSNPFTGTSASAPHVAAIAGLYYSRYPTHTTGNFFSAMTSSASTIQTGQGGQYNSVSGFGKIRAYDALVKGLTTLVSPQVTSNTTWTLVRVTGTGNISADKIVTIPASTTSLIEGTITFGNANAQISVQGTLILAATASVDPGNLFLVGNGRIVGGNFVSVTVTQLDEQSTPFDSVARWRSGIFEKHIVPYNFAASNHSSETFRSKQNFKSGTPQKYNNWEQSSNVANHQTFTVDSSHASFISHFKTAENGILVKTDLIDAPGTTGGSIQFRDPWYIDSMDAQHGNNWCNRGMIDAVYRTRSVGTNGFKPDTSTVYPESPYPYRGVFFNQNPTWDPTKPNYSVGAPSPNYINGFTAYFDSWTGTNVSFQNAGSAQTGVVFNGSSATATALYKAHLLSTSSTATATNNQRKVAQSDQGVFCLVYEANDRIWFSHSSDGVNWSGDVSISNGSEGPLNKYPSIVIKGSIANVVWQAIDWWGPPFYGNGYIYLRRYNIATDTWGPLEHIASFLPTSENFLATPVIDAMSLSADGASQELKRLAWRDNEGIKVIDNNYGTWSEIALVPATHSECYYPSIVNYNGDSYALCWEDQSTETIQYIEASYSHSWSWDRAAQVSPVGWYLNQRPSMAMAYQSGGCTGAKPTIVWQSVDNVVEGVSVHVRQNTFGCNTWGNVTSFSIGTGASPHPAVGSYGSNNKLSVVWNISNDVYVATYNGSAWSAPGLLATGAEGGTECNINAQTPSTLAALWRRPDGGITITSSGVNPGDPDGPLSLLGDSTGTPVPYRLNRHGFVPLAQAIGSKVNGVSGMMAFEIARMKLSTPAGDTTLAYSDVESLQPGRSVLSSQPFTVAVANSRLVFAGAAYGKRLSVPRDSLATVNQPLARVVLRDNGTGQIRKQLWRLPFSELSEIQDSTFGTFREFTVDLDDLLGREVYLEVQMLGHARQVIPLVDDDYLILGGPSQSLLARGSSEKTIPRTYSLHQNYPNPFNPTTTIRFDLPEAQEVSLKVFNVLGQEITTLATGLHEAGEHSVTADFSNLPSGMYIYRLMAGTFNAVKKLILVK